MQHQSLAAWERLHVGANDSTFNGHPYTKQLQLFLKHYDVTIALGAPHTYDMLIGDLRGEMKAICTGHGTYAAALSVAQVAAFAAGALDIFIAHTFRNTSGLTPRICILTAAAAEVTAVSAGQQSRLTMMWAQIPAHCKLFVTDQLTEHALRDWLTGRCTRHVA
jgi:hypothetical protein